MTADARSDTGGRRRDFGPKGPLVRTRRAAALGLGGLIVITVAVMVAMRDAAWVIPFAPALLPAMVGTVVIAVVTAVRERDIARGPTLVASSTWAGRRGIVRAGVGASLIVVGPIVLEVGLLLVFSSTAYLSEPLTSAQVWQERWGWVIAFTGGIGVLVGAVLYPVAAIKASTARASRLQNA
jgi:hypothetical protein